MNLHGLPLLSVLALSATGRTQELLDELAEMELGNRLAQTTFFTLQIALLSLWLWSKRPEDARARKDWYHLAVGVAFVNLLSFLFLTRIWIWGYL